MPSLPPRGYRLVFSEDFSGPLDLPPGTGWGSGHKWLAHTPYGGDFSDAWFTGPSEPLTDNPFLIDSKKGQLSITAWIDPAWAHWRSGLLASVDTTGMGFSQALGYWECCMKFPAGEGLWPSFWLTSINNISTPKRNSPAFELDIVEAYGVDTQVLYTSAHVWDTQGNDSLKIQFSTRAKVSTTSNFRIYSAWVRQDQIIVAVDGYVIATITTPPEGLQPLYCLVDLGVGGGWPINNTPNPSALKIDYIRCYAPSTL